MPVHVVDNSNYNEVVFIFGDIVIGLQIITIFNIILPVP